MTALIIIALFACMALSVRRMILNKKSGKCSCGCSCCSGECKCGKETN